MNDPTDDGKPTKVAQQDPKARGPSRRLVLVGGGGLPLLIQVSPAGVWFASSNDGADDAFFAAAPTFPAGTDKTLRDGSYDVVTTNPDGTLCYGWEPGPDAGDCEDVCFADLCVAPGQGIVSGSGNWWPNAEMYRAVAK